MESVNTGTAITYATSAAAGASFTINEAGLYAIETADSAAADTVVVGVSVDSSALTTEIFNISYAQGRRGYTETVSARVGAYAITLRLAAAAVVRPHQEGTADDTTEASFFSIMKIGN